MNARTIVTSLATGLLLIACGGSTPDPTASTAADLSRLADGGLRGKACKPLDSGPSPCARGDGGDDEGDAAEIENDNEDGGGRARDGAARGSDGDGGDQADDSKDGGGRPDGAGRH
jgi:hypothetical protein